MSNKWGAIRGNKMFVVFLVVFVFSSGIEKYLFKYDYSISAWTTFGPLKGRGGDYI